MRPILLLLVLVLAACGDSSVAGTPDSDAPIPVEPDGGIGDTAASGDPIPVEPDGGIGDGSGAPQHPATAPPFGVSSEVDSAAVEPFTYCWNDDAGAGVCADGIPTSRHELAADAQLVVTYPEGTLTAMSSDPLPGEGPGVEFPEQSPLPVEQENPGIWLVDISGLAAGEHAVWLSWNGDPGDSHTVLSISIER